MNTLVPLLIATSVIGLISGLMIWVVSKLGLGLEVDNLGVALLAGIVIAFLAGIFTLLLSLVGLGDGAGFVGGVFIWLSPPRRS